MKNKIEIINSSEEVREHAYSKHDSTYRDEVGKIVKPTEKFDEDWQNECSTGVHFFITRVEAENY